MFTQDLSQQVAYSREQKSYTFTKKMLFYTIGPLGKTNFSLADVFVLCKKDSPPLSSIQGDELLKNKMWESLTKLNFVKLLQINSTIWNVLNF